MKLAKIPIDLILKIVFWICRAFVDWYWKYADMPYPSDTMCWLHPTNEDVKRWHELKDMECDMI